MLYVSRINEDDSFCVKDTDDNKETHHTRDELFEACVFLGIKIYGCELSPTGVLTKVTVFDYHAELSRTQLKYKMLYDVNVVMSDDLITSIRVGDRMPKVARVRLSDFGGLCSSYIVGDTYVPAGRKLILVLDNGVVINSKTFSIDYEVDNIFVDATEVTDKGIIETLYSTSSINLNDAWSDWSVIDRKERHEYYRAVNMVVGRAVNPLDKFDGFSDLATIYEEMCKRFGREFLELARADFTISHDSNIEWHIRFWIHSPPVINFLQRYKEGVVDYSFCANNFYNLAGILLATTDLDEGPIKRVMNLVQHFELTTDLHEPLVEFCTKLVLHYSRFWTDRGGELPCSI